MDADEFYGSLIDKIENDIKKLYSTDSTPPTGDEKNTPKDAKETNYKYKNIFNYFFGIKVLDELKFVDCGHKRYNEFCYNSIQLEIKGCDNIYDSLKNYFKTENGVADGADKFIRVLQVFTRLHVRSGFIVEFAGGLQTSGCHVRLVHYRKLQFFGLNGDSKVFLILCHDDVNYMGLLIVSRK